MAKRKSMTDAHLKRFKRGYESLLAKRRAGDHAIITYLSEWAKKFDKDVLLGYMGTVLGINSDDAKAYYRLFGALKIVRDERLWAALSRKQIHKVAEVADGKARRKVTVALLEHLDTTGCAVVADGAFRQAMQAYVKPARNSDGKKKPKKKAAKKTKATVPFSAGSAGVRRRPGEAAQDDADAAAAELEELHESLNKLRDQFREVVTKYPFVPGIIHNGCSEPDWVLETLGLPAIKSRKRRRA